MIAEGRPAAPLPDTTDDQYYERRRIKRTVPLDPVLITARWDRLHGAVDGTPILNTYCDWDDQYLYFAVETAGPEEVRIDIDGAGDGWLRGADNLSVRVAPAGDGPSFCSVTAQRWDTIQNRDRPVWAASPIPVEALKAVQGRGGAGTMTVVAVPATEVVGLIRRSGVEFGLRLSAGAGVATGDRAEINLKPLLRLGLSDDIAAAGGGISVRFFVRDREIVAGEVLRGSLEARNESNEPVTLRRFFYAGSLAADGAVDSANQNEVTLKPGEKVRKDFKTTVGASLGVASFVLLGGAELSTGAQVVALTSATRVEPFAVTLDLDDKPVPTGANELEQRQRLAVVAVRNRVDQKVDARITLKLPDEWNTESGETSRTLKLAYATEVKSASFKIVVPRSTAPGTYTIGATVEAGGKKYDVAAVLRVIGAK